MNRRQSGAILTAALALLGATPAEPQPANVVVLRPGARLIRQFDVAGSDRLIVPLTSGWFVKIVVMQSGSDVVVTFRDPRGQVLLQSDSPLGAYGPETIATIAMSSGDHELEVKLGNARTSKGAYEVTLEAQHEATQADRALVAAHRDLGEALRLMRTHTPASRQTALNMLRPTREYFAAEGNRYYQAFAIAVEGSMRAEAGDIRTALSNQEEAAGLFREAGDWRGQAVTRNNIGGMLDVLGDPVRALESYRQSLSLATDNGDRAHQAIVLNNIGKIESDFGNWQDALHDYSRALPLVGQSGNTRSEGLLLNNIANANRALGNFQEAFALYEQALPLRRAAGDKRGEAETLRSIANAHRVQKHAALGVPNLEQALTLYRELGDKRSEAETCLNLAKTFAELGEVAKARQYLDQTLALETTVQDRRTTALALLASSTVHSLSGDPAKSITEGTQALSEFRAIGDRDSEANALETIARAESDRGSLPESRRRMEEALTLIEATRGRTDSQQLRASFFATRQDSYGFYIDLLMRMGSTADALEAAERSHARSLLEMLSESGAGLRAGVDEKLLAREHEISNLLNAKGARLLTLAGRDTPQSATLKQEIRALEAEFQDTQAAIRKSSPRYATLTQPTPLTAAHIQSELLDADSLLLEYALGEKRSYLWAVSRTGVIAWELPSREKIEAQAARVSELLTARSVSQRMETPAARQKRIDQADAALPSAARQLSQMVLAPAASVLAGKRLAVVPDGALQRVPFAMLPLPGSDAPLVASHETVMLPSASALGALRAEVAGRKPAPRMLAVFADPVFDAADPRVGRPQGPTQSAASPEASRVLEHLADPGDGAAKLKIPRLPFTLQEADQILRVAPDPSNLRAVGFQASRATAIGGQLSQFRYLHFATHGYLDTERPSLSALVLSQIDEKKQPQDGFLRVNDIYNARMPAELVVLSACQTGLGQEVRGEGLMGLTRAFLYAGAPRVVVSLWNVNDRATAGLMTGFYRAMLREGKRPAAALREAQMALRKQKRWESPYYWAAFVQHGDWR